MIEASSTFWTIFIILIWVVSAVVEFKRKQKLKEMRARAAREALQSQNIQEEQEEEQPEEEEASPDATSLSSYQELERAEEEVRSHAYRPIPVGANLEVGAKDLILPTLDQDLEARLENLERENEALKSSLQAFERKNAADLEQPLVEGNSPMRESRAIASKRLRQQLAASRKGAALPALKAKKLRNPYLASLPNAIVAKEILNRPISKRQKVYGPRAALRD